MQSILHGTSCPELTLTRLQGDFVPVLPSVDEAGSINNGDGLVTSLFRKLWEKDPYERSCVGVMLPDSIVIRHHNITDWFFTAKVLACTSYGTFL